MSGQLVGRCYELRLRSTQRELLIALADHADDFGNNVYPAVSYLAWKLDCNRTTVQRNLRALQALGESAPGANDGVLQLVREATPEWPREYRIVIDRGDKKPRYEAPSRGRQIAHPPAVQNAAPPQPGAGGGGIAAPPEPPEEPSVGENARAPRGNISGHTIDAACWTRTVAAIAQFNAAADRRLRPVDGTGAPSDAAKRVYGRLRAHPELDDVAVATIIDRTLASRWWGQGPPSIGVVFGPKIWDENLQRPVGAAPPPDPRAERRQRGAEGAAALDRLMGMGS